MFWGDFQIVVDVVGCQFFDIVWIFDCDVIVYFGGDKDFFDVFQFVSVVIKIDCWFMVGIYVWVNIWIDVGEMVVGLFSVW